MKTNMAYWNDVMNSPSDAYKKWFEDERTYLHHTIAPNAKVLEIGCGDGRSLFDVLPITQDIVGIDHDDSAIALAKKNFSMYPSIEIIKAEGEHLPFEDELFDCLICMGSFTNFADKKFAILEEMKRVLKKQGKLIISVFSEEALPERMKVYEKIGIQIKEINSGNVVFADVVDDNVSEQFSREQLECIFDQAHLRVADITKVDIAYLCTLMK